MAERKTTSSRTKKSAAEISAGRANLAQGRKKKQEKAEQAKREGRESAGERWARLLDGSLSVANLDDEEISRVKVRGADGAFNKGRAVPSHLLQQFHSEAIKRANDKLRTAVPEAVQALIDIGKDPAVKEGDRIRALQYVVDRALGKTPETVHIKSDDPWGALERDAVSDDRSMADFAESVERDLGDTVA